MDSNDNLDLTNRDESKEWDLSGLWAAASYELKGYNDELSELCHLKAQYWANPDRAMEKGDVDLSIKISISNMIEKVDALFKPEEYVN